MRAYTSGLCGSRPWSVRASNCSRVPSSRRAKSRIASTNARCSSVRFRRVTAGAFCQPCPVLIRHADPDRDAAACAAIYAPFVSDSPVSMEETPLDRAGMAERIASMSGTYPWLVAEHDGETAGYAYASQHRTRSAYRWAVDVTVYVAAGHRRRGIGRALYGSLLPLLRDQGFHNA